MLICSLEIGLILCLYLKQTTAVLDDRLHKKRKTERKAKNKLDKNVGAEIFVIQEFQESFNPEK